MCVEYMIRSEAVKIHSSLREIKMLNKDKPLFISVILLAFHNKTWKDEYIIFEKSKTKEFAAAIISSAEIMMTKNAACTAIKVEIIEQFKIICQTYFEKYNGKYSLFYFVDELAKNVYKYFRQNSEIDLIGIFYHEFFSNSANNRLSGIVLTPIHIADFMAEVIGISEGAKVLDICCGSGGLLASAQNKMNGKGDLVGCEINDDIYSLAVLTLAMHSASENSRIIHGDCFSATTVNQLNCISYTHGLINPPYAHREQNEFLFMMKELSLLEKHGLAAVLCPCSCAIGTKFKKEREQIMKAHTLKAVFSMPEALFAGNGAQINTCIMLWEAHVPHDSTKLTFFGRYTDDGLRRCSRKGRADLDNKWSSIKETWINLYRSQRVAAGMSLTQCVSADDEWLYESFANTDYNDLSKFDFEQTILRYLSYCIKVCGAESISQ